MNTKTVLSQIYKLTNIPFLIINYNGTLEHVFPDEFRDVYIPMAFASPPDTIGEKGKDPDGTTIIEMYDGCYMAVAKIDENYYIKTPPIGASFPELLPWGYISQFIVPDKKEEYIYLIKNVSAVEIPKLANVLCLIKSIFCDNISPNINYFRAPDKKAEIVPLEGTDFSLCSKYTYSVIVYIQDYIYENISVSDICSHIGLNRNSLSRYFKKDMGITISAYIQKQKLLKARELLLNKNLSITDISNILKYSDQGYFTQQFRKEFDMTPKQCRMRYGHNKLR